MPSAALAFAVAAPALATTTTTVVSSTTSTTTTTLPLTSADDVCPPNANPCAVGTTIVVVSRSVLDFGSRALVIAKGGSLDVGAGTMTIRAGSFDVQPRGSLLSAGGVIAVTVTGDISVERSADGRTSGVLDVSSPDGGGEVDLTAAGRITIAGVIDGHGASTDADGGTIDVVAAGDVTVTSADDALDVHSGSQGGGGTISLSSTAGSIHVAHRLDASGGDYDGGEIDMDAQGDLAIDALDVSASGSQGASGGYVDITAKGDVTMGGQIDGQGAGMTGGGAGDGADVSVIAMGALRLVAPVDTSSGDPDGLGGSIDLEGAAGRTVIGAGLNARGTGAGACGGDVTLAGRDGVDASAPMDVSGGPDCGGGSVTVYATGEFNAAGEINADGDRGSIMATAGTIVVSATGHLHANVSATESGGEVQLIGRCGLDVASGGTLSTLGTGGVNLLQAGEVLRVEGSVVAGMANELQYRDPATHPVVTGTVLPSPQEALNPSLTPCAPITTSTSTSTSTTVATSTSSTSTTAVIGGGTSSTTTTSWPTTTVPRGSTTTTTIPDAIGCREDGECDDGDACTTDRCAAAGCMHDEPLGVGSAICRLDAIAAALDADPTGVSSASLRRRLHGRVAKTTHLLTAAATAKHAHKKLGQAAAQLNGFLQAVRKTAGTTIDASLASRIEGLAEVAAARVSGLMARARR